MKKSFRYSLIMFSIIISGLAIISCEKPNVFEDEGLINRLYQKAIDTLEYEGSDYILETELYRNLTPGAPLSGDRPLISILYLTNLDSQTILEYSSFSIGEDAAVNFYNGTDGVTLNRVVACNPSEIFGSLWAQGEIFLINQSGILFGPNSSVDVNGLVASTLDIKDQDFLDGKMNFFGREGFNSVINNGSLKMLDFS